MAKKTFYILTGFMIGVIVLGITSLASANRNHNSSSSNQNTVVYQAVETIPPIQQSELASTSDFTSIPSADVQETVMSPTLIPENIDLPAAPVADQAQEPQIKTGDQPADLIETVAYLKARIHTHIDVSGWLYIKKEFFDFKNTGDGVDMLAKPKHYIEEVWFHLNDEGVVFEHVDLMKSMDGTILETTVQHDGKSWNSNSNQTIDLAPFKLGDLDGGVLDRYLEFAYDNPHNIEYTELNGFKVIKISGTENFGSPITLDGYAKQISGIVAYNYFDIETGRLLQTEDVAIFEDGSNQLFDRVIINTELGLTPSADIVNLVSKK